MRPVQRVGKCAVCACGGRWAGSRWPLSNVDMLISVCIRSSTLVCSPACNMGGWMAQEEGGEAVVVLWVVVQEPLNKGQADSDGLTQSGFKSVISFDLIWLNAFPVKSDFISLHLFLSPLFLPDGSPYRLFFRVKFYSSEPNNLREEFTR